MENLRLAAKQQGVVLIVALIMVVAVTGIAVTLMSSSSVDMKITNAAFEREEAENALMGNVQQVIADEATKGGTSYFLYTRAQIPNGSIALDKVGDTVNSMSNLNNGALDLPCPRKFSFTAGISCNMVQVDSTITYGSKSKHTITITTGIAQEMASLNTGG
ncbi:MULTISPECIES: pilus assembly protein PilX [unclassified Pseudoalteromonas]|uniref:pilus assembly PilX family protein n=1 Tax=unclassified Pseudoalteromonas TaxID=194690 RepID=UPI000B3C44EB|nr:MULTISPECIES: pilus assembly protein PilX [unclassified Pseudoalteromonas]MDN3377000.1 pilus assembly protein PilX [Pseudoalteromonas sp. APC 3893]MDN3388506.1 pilus assembly protein PilX [Pseudoalteromonas sp. APC 4017]OUS72624.1 pilus assembly protein PilX [Pseudoalteromonas sp. A601]